MVSNTKYKKLLKFQKIRATNVAKLTGLSNAQISAIANNSSNFTIRTIKNLCKFHNCTPNDIINWEDWFTQPKKQK